MKRFDRKFGVNFLKELPPEEDKLAEGASTEAIAEVTGSEDA